MRLSLSLRRTLVGRALLNAEAVLALLLAWGMVFLLPFRWTCRMFGGLESVSTARSGVGGAEISRAVHVVWRLRKMADRLPWRSTCLVRAVAGRLLLERRGIAGAVIRFGVRPEAGRTQAHAWLMLGDTLLMGGDEATGFQAVADLSAS